MYVGVEGVTKGTLTNLEFDRGVNKVWLEINLIELGYYSKDDFF